jgi:hypothetical protein
VVVGEVLGKVLCILEDALEEGVGEVVVVVGEMLGGPVVVVTMGGFGKCVGLHAR